MDLNEVVEMLKPFHEASVVYAAGYAKACGRNTVTLQDMEYASKYAARYVVGVHTQSVFPEVYEEDSTDEDEEYTEDDEPEDEFTRYQGNDEKMNLINQCYDTWDEWEPIAPLQVAAKNAIQNFGNR
jgi:hypothetical protein